MAAITITRKFTDFELESVPLLSAHLPSSIEFQFDRGTETNTYAEVVINTIAFKAIKTTTVGNSDFYVLGGEMLAQFLGIPTLAITNLTKLQLAMTVVCNGYSSTGTLLATASHSAFKICNAISADANDGLYFVQTNGRSKKVYHSGIIFYFDVTNQIYKSANTTATGTYTADGCNFEIEYIAGTPNIYWLNSDGCYDCFEFTELSINRQGKLSNPISLYSNRLIDWKGYEQNIRNEVVEEIVYRTIAKNTEHYAQLYFMAQSPLIMNVNGELFEMSQYPAPIAACKQNLNFTFSLKRKTHAQSY
jgi:hypothetical protein